MRHRRLLGSIAVGFAAIALLCGASARNADAVVAAALTPPRPFEPSALPPAPDYADPAAWSAFPGVRQPPPLPGVAVPTDPPADVFYVHPTSYIGRDWNGPVDDPRLNADTDRVATDVQADVFVGCCAVFAPRYRQTNGLPLVRRTGDGDRALDVATADVRAALQVVLARNRPIVLASHSQGTPILARLLDDVPRERLVAAYLIGAPVHPRLPACEGPDDVGCAVSYNARSPGYRPGRLAILPVDDPLCTNPISWRTDESAAPASDSRGAVFDGVVLPAFADARCRDGVLVVSEIGVPPRDLPSRVLDWMLGPGNYHPIEYQMFALDLAANADRRVAAHRR